MEKSLRSPRGLSAIVSKLGDVVKHSSHTGHTRTMKEKGELVEGKDMP